MNKVTDPKVSVIMSVYNGEKYLREAVDSILNQTFTDFEFIIINDGSTDRTRQILESYSEDRIVCLHNPQNTGLPRSLNRGLTVARGEFMARQDADDVSLPERLTNQLLYFRSHPNVGLLGTVYYVIDSEGKQIATHRPPPSDSEIRWQMLFHDAFCHTSVMFRRQLFDIDKPFYNEALPYSQDYDLWARLLRRTSAANLQVPLVKFRIHDSSISTIRYGEQQRLASRTAAHQINALMPQRLLTESEVDTLRRWYCGFPHRLNKQDMALCRLLLKILKAFGTQENVDPDVFRNIQQRWIRRILSAISREQLLDLCTLPVLWHMLRNESKSVLAHASKRAICRIRRFVDVTQRT